MKNIGKTLRIIRETAGLKQGELANIVNVSSNYISLIENQKKEPSLKFLNKVAEEFDIPVSVFLWNDLNIENIKDSNIKEITEKINNLFWDLIKNNLSSNLNNNITK